jgi:hypothetical protein
MSKCMESLLTHQQRAECKRHDEELALATRTVTRASLGSEPTLRFRGLKFERTTGAAFKDASYGNAFEPHVPPPLWSRVALFFKRNFT